MDHQTCLCLHHWFSPRGSWPPWGGGCQMTLLQKSQMKFTLYMTHNSSKICYEVAVEIILWLELLQHTAWGTVVKDRRVRMVENQYGCWDYGLSWCGLFTRIHLFIGRKKSWKEMNWHVTLLVFLHSRFYGHSFLGFPTFPTLERDNLFIVAFET